MPQPKPRATDRDCRATRALDRREKEILAQAKKYLRQQGLAPSGAGGIEAAAAAVSAASKSSTHGANGNNAIGVDEGPLSAAALAAKRVAEARASALEEDALYARMGGAPPGVRVVCACVCRRDGWAIGGDPLRLRMCA